LIIQPNLLANPIKIMGHRKTTSAKVARTASKALRSKSTSRTTKRLAGSALAQKHRRGSKH
jgi:hypothetical protein